MQVKSLETLDLRGIPCPTNSARALIRLEVMDEGQILKLILDDGEPAENVPDSLIEEGYIISSKEQKENIYILLVQKGRVNDL